MRCLIALVLALSVPGLVVAQNRNQSVEREIEQAEYAYNNARLANDIAALNRMTATDFFDVSARGTSREIGNQRTQPVNMTPSGVMEKSELRNMRVRVYGDSAISTYEQHVGVRRSDGSPVEVNVITTHVWVRGDGRWLLVLMHSTFL
jgi:ketosteroid isomerase-like protein